MCVCFLWRKVWHLCCNGRVTRYYYLTIIVKDLAVYRKNIFGDWSGGLMFSVNHPIRFIGFGPKKAPMFDFRPVGNRSEIRGQKTLNSSLPKTRICRKSLLKWSFQYPVVRFRFMFTNRELFFFFLFLFLYFFFFCFYFFFVWQIGKYWFHYQRRSCQ